MSDTIWIDLRDYNGDGTGDNPQECEVADSPPVSIWRSWQGVWMFALWGVSPQDDMNYGQLVWGSAPTKAQAKRLAEVAGRFYE
jgi:hypothetical protein